MPLQLFDMIGRVIWILLFCILLLNHSFGQRLAEIGYTGGSLNSFSSVAGGLSIYEGKNFYEKTNFSFSVSTNVKLGIEDKIGSGLFISLLLLLGDNNTYPDLINNDGGKIHLFAEVPMLLHYNFGIGSTAWSVKRGGFYIGGGINFIATGYTDTAGFSKKTALFGYVMDGGIWFRRNVDLNFLQQSLSSIQ